MTAAICLVAGGAAAPGGDDPTGGAAATAGACNGACRGDDGADATGAAAGDVAGAAAFFSRAAAFSMLSSFVRMEQTRAMDVVPPFARACATRGAHKSISNLVRIGA